MIGSAFVGGVIILLIGGAGWNKNWDFANSISVKGTAPRDTERINLPSDSAFAISFFIPSLAYESMHITVFSGKSNVETIADKDISW